MYSGRSDCFSGCCFLLLKSKRMPLIKGFRVIWRAVLRGRIKGLTSLVGEMLDTEIVFRFIN
jgi:hypothetical protein